MCLLPSDGDPFAGENCINPARPTRSFGSSMDEWGAHLLYRRSRPIRARFLNAADKLRANSSTSFAVFAER